VAAYKWVENQREELQFESVLKPHLKQTARRMAAEKVVLLAQDTTTLNYSGLEQTQGLGSTAPAGSRGLFLHALLAFRLDAIPLGVAWAEVWARPAVSDTDKRDEQSVADKESGRWLLAFQAAAQRAFQMPQTQLIVCGDRESDIFELYDHCEAAPENLHVLARGKHDRLLSNGQRLWDHLEMQPLGGRMKVVVPRRQNQPARQATLEIRWAANPDPTAIGGPQEELAEPEDVCRAGPGSRQSQRRGAHRMGLANGLRSHESENGHLDGSLVRPALGNRVLAPSAQSGMRGGKKTVPHGAGSHPILSS